MFCVFRSLRSFLLVLLLATVDCVLVNASWRYVNGVADSCYNFLNLFFFKLTQQHC